MSTPKEPSVTDYLNEASLKFDPVKYTGQPVWSNSENRPSQDALRALIASLMWTTGLQTDIDDFLAKYPHLRPPKEP